MPKIALITDTDCSLPEQVARQYGIRQVPITIHFDDKTYTTNVDIDDHTVFQLIDQHKKLPTTSAPSPSAFAAAYDEAFHAGAKSIVCVCVSSQVSSTYSAALTACEPFPGRDIRVVDSMMISMGQGLMVLAGAEAIQAGASSEQVVEVITDTGRRTYLYAVLATLKYLALSGRVGKLVAGMADSLNIKPVLTIQGGKLELLERIRTRKKAIERMLELTRASLGGKQVERAAIIHVDNPQGARELEALLREALPVPTQIVTGPFTPGLSVHAGAGVVGVALVACK